METLASSSTKTPHDFLSDVDISLIQISSTNDMFRDPGDLEEIGLKELIDSIRQKGLLQPILLRPHGNGFFILVAGERRYRACKALGMESIPAFVKDMKEEEAFELQLTENLQRKDVHPLKEAKAFKYLQDKGKYNTGELALRFGKSESYILQRLKLNSLIPEASKDFSSGVLSLAQALEIARLQPEDQTLVVKECSQTYDKKKFYQSTTEIKDFIEDNITRDLSQAPFDIQATDLVPKAGSCLTCQKRSGAQSLLFSDIKEKDRCFDSKCFMAKKAVGVLEEVKKLVDKKPDTLFLEWTGYEVEKPAQSVMSFLAGHKIKPLEGRKDFYEDAYYHQHYKKKTQGFVLNGPYACRFKTVYVRGTNLKDLTESSDKPAAEDVKEAIARIKERTKRAAELDSEKVYSRIIDEMKKDMVLADPNRKPTRSELGLLAYVVYDKMDYHLRDKKIKTLQEEMTAKAFEELVRRMRSAQKHYYKLHPVNDRDQKMVALIKARQLEQEVDRAEIDDIHNLVTPSPIA